MKIGLEIGIQGHSQLQDLLGLVLIHLGSQPHFWNQSCLECNNFLHKILWDDFLISVQTMFKPRWKCGAVFLASQSRWLFWCFWSKQNGCNRFRSYSKHQWSRYIVFWIIIYEVQGSNFQTWKQFFYPELANRCLGTKNFEGYPSEHFTLHKVFSPVTLKGFGVWGTQGSRGLGWRGHTCVKDLPWVGGEVCAKFGGDWSGGSREKEEYRYSLFYK